MATRPATAAPPTRRRRASRPSEAGLETRERLLDAAERLFAERGLDSVSVRDITDAADANIAAIHYHFGSKQDLIAAVLHRRADALGARRDELLAAIESRDEPTLREAVEALVRPTAELAGDAGGGRHYVAFLAALGGSPELMHLVVDAYAPHTGRMLTLLGRVTPELPEDVRLLRFAISKDLINRVLGQPGGQIHAWVAELEPGVDVDIVGELVDILVGVFSAPVRKRMRSRRRSA